jgi:hypothetical protein
MFFGDKSIYREQHIQMLHVRIVKRDLRKSKDPRQNIVSGRTVQVAPKWFAANRKNKQEKLLGAGEEVFWVKPYIKTIKHLR